MTDEMVNREFSRVFKGYDVDEVEDYIEALAELYNQVANENRELALRCDALNGALTENNEKLAELQGISERRDEIIAEAQKEAHSIIIDAREKAQATIDTAESTARQLLLGIKEKSESVERELAERREQTDAQCKATLDAAIDEAKTLIKATKLNCQKRQSESEQRMIEAQRTLEESLTEKREEYERLCQSASEFRRRLIELYSGQIASLGTLEAELAESIPAALSDSSEDDNAGSELECEISAQQSAIEEVAPQHDSCEPEEPDEVEEIEEIEEIDAPDEYDVISETERSDGIPDTEEAEDNDTQVSEDDTSEPVTDSAQPEDVITDESAETEEDESSVAENMLDAVSDAEVEHSEPEISEHTVVFDAPIRERREKSFAPFEIHKESSGVVAYDSSELSSVRQKLDDIRAKNGDSSNNTHKSVSKKLGFLK